MQSSQQSQRWLLAADDRRAILLKCEPIEHSRWHLQQCRELENRWENYHQRHRPSALGRGPSANAAQHFASNGHQDDEEQRRFARDVVRWLSHAMCELSIEHVEVFTPARMLGHLRNELNGGASMVTLHEGELTRHRTCELATHPAVVHALEKRS